jgi:hypothetical protein
MAQVTGRCWLYVDGLLVRSKEGAKLTGVGLTERTAIVGPQVWGYAEKTVPPTVEATLAHTADLSLAALGQIVDATITFETDTGRTFVLRHAWAQSAPDLTAGEGDVSMTFAGMSIEELAA